MNKEHFNKFSECINDSLKEEQWVGNNINKWWKWVSAKTETQLHCDALPNNRLTRKELKSLCSNNSGASDLACSIAIMAWGGQNRNHGITLFNRFDEIKPIIKDMRKGNINHIEAYKQFYKIWIAEKPLGMGAAYFSKLIFFCEPSHKGYIMDQWTSKSINMLTNEPIVHLISNHVSNKNTDITYSTFCNTVDNIAQTLGYKGEEIEIAMFSKGGRNKWQWREYVCNNYNKQT